ncbi:MAG: Flp family type IVb pilin [Acidobacteriaceae bacterium]|jgi:pilus assembly protein Flp/PilA
MNIKFWTLCIRMRDLMSGEDGQDLIEYALVVALIALGATAGMQTVAADINNAFGTIGNTLTSAIS